MQGEGVARLWANKARTVNSDSYLEPDVIRCVDNLAVLPQLPNDCNEVAAHLIRCVGDGARTVASSARLCLGS